MPFARIERHRRRAALRRALLALCFACTALSVTGPALVDGATFGATDILQFAAPYREASPRLPEVGNPLQTDQMEQIPVVARFYRSARQGELQLWDPNHALGVPLLLAVHSRILAPWNVVFLVVPLALGTTVATTLALVAGQAGTYALARRLGIGLWGGLLAAVAYVYSGPSMAMLLRIHEVLLFPLLLYAVHGALVERARRGRYLALTALTTAAVLLSGFPAAGLYIGYATVAFAAVVVWHAARRPATRPGVLAASVTTALAAVAGVLVAAVVLLPAFEFLARSGSLEREFDSTHAAGVVKLASAVSGRFFGTYQHGTWWWPEPGYANPFEASLTAGLVVLGLLGLAVAWRGLRLAPTAETLLGTALLPAALVTVTGTYLGGPLLGLLQLLPFVATNSFGRSRFIASLALALAAGAVLDGLVDRDADRRRPGKLVRVQVAALLGLVGVATFRGLTEAARLDQLTTVAGALAVPLAAAAAAFVAVRTARARPALAGLAVTAACVAELVWGAWGFTPASPAAWFYPDSPAFAPISDDVGEGGLYRFAGLSLNPVPAHAASYLGLGDLRIAFPSWQRYRQLMEAADPAVWDHRRLRPVFTDGLDVEGPVLDRMSVRYLVDRLAAPPLQLAPATRFALPEAELPTRVEVPVPDGGIRRLVVPVQPPEGCDTGWVEAAFEGTRVRRLVRELRGAAEFVVADARPGGASTTVEIRSTHCPLRTSGVPGGVHGPEPAGRLDVVAADGWVVYRRPAARPRVELATASVRIDDAQDRLDFLASEPADGPSVTEAGPGRARYGGGTATLTADDPDRLTVQVVSRGPGLLVIRDSYAPGWRAEVDGVATDVVPVDHALRGVAVPDGRSEVVLSYAPPLMVAGAWLSLGGLVLTAVLAASGVVAPTARRGRRPGP